MRVVFARAQFLPIVDTTKVEYFQRWCAVLSTLPPVSGRVLYLTTRSGVASGSQSQAFTSTSSPNTSSATSPTTNGTPQTPDTGREARSQADCCVYKPVNPASAHAPKPFAVLYIGGRQLDSNKEAFERVPDSFLERLTELLSIPMLGCDVLAPKAGASSAEWLDTNCRVLPPSIAGVDGEVNSSFCLCVCALEAKLNQNTSQQSAGLIPACSL